LKPKCDECDEKDDEESDLGSDEKSTLEKLGLSRNDLGVEAARVLSNMLKTNSRLKSLSVHRNCIDNDGASALAGALKQNNSLEILDVVDGNGIGSAGAIEIYDALASENNSLKGIDLRGNPKNDDDGATFIAQTLIKNDHVGALCRRRFWKSRSEGVCDMYSPHAWTQDPASERGREGLYF
jgi:hypothetical protein